MEKFNSASAAQGPEQTFNWALEQNLVNSRGTERFHYSREDKFFFPSLFSWPCITENSTECTLWAVEVNKPYKIEILINQAIMNYTL